MAQQRQWDVGVCLCLVDMYDVPDTTPAEERSDGTTNYCLAQLFYSQFFYKDGIVHTQHCVDHRNSSVLTELLESDSHEWYVYHHSQHNNRELLNIGNL